MKTALSFLLFFVANSLLSQNSNISEGDVFDGEPYVAIHPDNPQHIVIAWMGWVNLANKFQIKTRTSFDGGETWTETITLPHTVDGYSSADPCVDFNHRGEVFISYIDFTGLTPPVTGGVYISRSSDRGLSWGDPMEVISTSFDGDKWPIDRPWMVIDKSESEHQGHIYISSFNLNRINPPYNPYLSISTDDGESFTTRLVDDSDWLAGVLNPFPICSPTVNSSGVLFASYPSLVLSQSPFTQSFMAISTDGGISLSHKKIITDDPPSNLQDYPLAKKGALLISNPSDPDHVAFFYLSAHTGDLDVYLTESFDAGDNWTSPYRLNDDPINNDRMQDMIWADFDNDGDLIVSWRDRRNGGDSTYQAATEIWATYRDKDSMIFRSNFPITTQLIEHDIDLEAAGNDFMCIKLQDDLLNAAWGDIRDGELNIWFQRMNTKGVIVSTNQISSEEVPPILIHPNPTPSLMHIVGEQISEIYVYDLNGKEVLKQKDIIPSSNHTLELSKFPPGTYIIKFITDTGDYIDKIIKL